MRVVAGRYKGHNLKTLKGDATRPTTMRVKESLFSSLTSAIGAFEGAIVLDAFAGSGGLGIEALSRGADRAVFFEKSRQAAQIVRDNLAKIGLDAPHAKVELGDSFRLVARKRPESFDLVFCDPPYAIAPEQVFELLGALDRCGSLHADALICYELAKKNEPAARAEADALKWNIVSSKDFGDTTYIILRKGD